MSLYELIMGEGSKVHFTKGDWSDLGQGKITDESIIANMLAEGYEGVDDSDSNIPF